MKTREAELEKSIEDKRQLKNQIHDLKAGLHNLQSTQVRKKNHTHTLTHAQLRNNFVFMFTFVFVSVFKM